MGKKTGMAENEFSTYMSIKTELEDIERMVYSLNQKIFKNAGILSRFDVQFIEIGDAIDKLFKNVRDVERKYDEALSRIALECEEERRKQHEKRQES